MNNREPYNGAIYYDLPDIKTITHLQFISSGVMCFPLGLSAIFSIVGKSNIPAKSNTMQFQHTPQFRYTPLNENHCALKRSGELCASAHQMDNSYG